MIPVDQAAASITQRGVPVVYIDTCSILDLIRGQREAFNGDQAQAAVRLIELAEASKISLAFPEQVAVEFRSNIDDTRQGGGRSVDDIGKTVDQIYATMHAYGVAVPAWPQMTGGSYLVAADAIVNRLMAVSIVSLTTLQSNQNAMQRVVAGRAPAASAKQSAKDCLVIESIYEVLSIARGTGFAAPAFFLSANVAEYADETKRKLHQDLVPEFLSLDLTFVRSYLELRYSPAIAAI